MNSSMQNSGLPSDFENHHSEIPEYWLPVRICDICSINPKVKLDDELDVGFMPMSGVPTTFFGKIDFETRKWKSVKTGYTQFANGDAIFAKITPCFENSKAAVIDGLPNGWGAGSTEYFVLRSFGSLVDPRLLFALVKTRDFLAGGTMNMSGSVGHKRVPKEFVEQYTFPLPPLAEQIQIANKLDELLAQVDTLKIRLDAIPHILKRFRQSVLAAAVSGRLTEDLRNGGLPNSSNDLLNELEFNKDKNRKVDQTSSHELVTENFPKHWGTSTFGEIYRLIDYRGKTPRKAKHGKRLYSAKNIKMGFVSNEPVEYLSDNEYQAWMTRGFSKIGDIFFVTEGHTMGCTAVNNIGTDIALAQRTLNLQPYGKVQTKFHLYYMMSSSFQKLLQLNSTGSAAKGIKAAKFRGLPIPFPSYFEQTEIVRRVEQLFAYADQIEQRVKDTQSRVNKLTQSILAKAFRGELTAEWRAQNPDLITGENSAEALLARIKAERAVAESGKKPKRARKG